eukprot:CAMPEP_0171261462 /NCGR_PEP_ID=MMETSP0790-20130122/56014_1 /TAXON_ID=2925 /ORGANISM="Alexandrium catenella, Strain OF101" /LENGTH=50 /DNA_ID=CAMNT_0011729885 /DNA_START=79 /DNA_END=227 /DNA_ORIENTATION=+
MTGPVAAATAPSAREHGLFAETRTLDGMAGAEHWQKRRDIVTPSSKHRST